LPCRAPPPATRPTLHFSSCRRFDSDGSATWRRDKTGIFLKKEADARRCLHDANYVTTVYNVNSIDIIFLCFMLWSSGVKMTELKDVCELARELVVKYNTQERAAEAAKVHQNIISRLCRGERSDVRLSTYKRMIDALETTV